MSVEAVVFDWGGTLTPYHHVDLFDLWRVAAAVLAPGREDEVAAALVRAEQQWWRSTAGSGGHCSGTTPEVLAAAAAATGLDVAPLLRDDALAAMWRAWTPHTVTDPAAEPLLRALRERGIRIGLLSNTHWPRGQHEAWLARDGVLELIDVRVYTSDLQHTKPHPEAFRAVLEQLGVPARQAVMVGDRPHDDIHGAQAAGMPTVLLPNNHVPSYSVHPDATIGALAELLPLIDSWRGRG